MSQPQDPVAVERNTWGPGDFEILPPEDPVAEPEDEPDTN